MSANNQFTMLYPMCEKLDLSKPTELIKLPNYELPVLIEGGSDDPCPKCGNGMTLHYTHIIPFITVDGIYMGSYRLEGHLYCCNCKQATLGKPVIPEAYICKPSRATQPIEQPQTNLQKKQNRKRKATNHK